ncbi:Dishevelled associated activator of morphogenesis 2, partial [Cladochytrium tenue]
FALAPPREQRFRPTTKLRPLQWTRLPDSSLQGTVWAASSAPAVPAVPDRAGRGQPAPPKPPSKPDLEQALADLGVFGELEAQFARAAAAVAAKADEGDGREVRLIKSARAQNIMIALKKYFKDFETVADLCDALTTVGRDSGTEFAYNEVLKCYPIPDEAKLVSAYAGDVEILRKAERFLFEIIKVPLSKERMESLQFKEGFAERFSALDQDIKLATGAFKSLKQSSSLVDMLKLILNIGNFMNTGTFSGSLNGFRISSINALADVRSAEGKTLLQFVAETVQEKFPDMLQFLDDICDVQPASRLVFETVRADIKTLQTELDTTKQVVERVRAHAETAAASAAVVACGRFLEFLAPFCASAADAADDLEQRSRALATLAQDVARRFGEDPSKTRPEELLATFAEFCAAFK